MWETSRYPARDCHRFPPGETAAVPNRVRACTQRAAHPATHRSLFLTEFRQRYPQLHTHLRLAPRREPDSDLDLDLYSDLNLDLNLDLGSQLYPLLFPASPATLFQSLHAALASGFYLLVSDSLGPPLSPSR